MLQFFSSLVLYNYNDASWFFLSKLISYLGNAGDYFPRFFLLSAPSNVDTLSVSIINYLNYLLHPVLLNNFFIATSLALNLLITYKLFRRCLDSKWIPFVYTATYSLSIYQLFRYVSATHALFLTFLFPLIFQVNAKRIHYLITGSLILTAFLLSAYYGLFALLLIVFWEFTEVSSWQRAKAALVKISVAGLPFVLFISLYYGSNLLRNVPLFSNYSSTEYLPQETEVQVLYRPLEDYYNFSFRPWYFFIPPKSSVFFGELSNNLYNKIASTGYYLADDYAEEEMAGSYMGWHFLLGLATIAILLLLKKYKSKTYPVFQNVYKNQSMIVRSFLMIFLILLISGPPSFTISGIEIYTPTYLLYYIVPVFRVLTRWAVVIYLFVLIINSYLVLDLYNLMKNKYQKAAFLTLFMLLNFVIFAIKLPVKDLNRPPSEVAYLKNLSDKELSYAVYPKADYYSIFWILSHERYLINPRDFVNTETGFDADEFTTQLITDQGLESLKEMGGDYLIYYPSKLGTSRSNTEKRATINEQIRTKEDVLNYFDQSPYLERVGEFTNPPYLEIQNPKFLNRFFEINDVDNHVEAVIYKIR